MLASMRKICLLLLIIPILKSEAQLQKENGIRYADVEYIFSQLPAAKQIESELRSLQAQLETRSKRSMVNSKRNTLCI
jgi:outer membrane protein